MKRSNEFIYVKRYYLLPFKPMLDYEYRKFGYKRFDVGRGDSKFFNTVYYVIHKEMPKPFLYTLAYLVNFILSLYRSLVTPILVGTFVLSFVIEGFMEVPTFIPGLLSIQFYGIFLAGIATLASVALCSFASKIYSNEDLEGKTDRALRSHGWTPWSAYEDNDPRLSPFNEQSSRGASAAPMQQSVAVSQSNNNNNVIDDDDDSDIISLQGPNGEMVDFTHIATIANRGKLYVLLVPREKLEGMDDDECLVFECTQNAEGEDSFNIEMDDAIIDEVMAQYDKLYEESHQQ